MDQQQQGGLMRYAILVGLVLSLNVACSGGGNSVVKNAQINTYANSGEQYADVSVDVNLFGMSLPSLSFPIQNPKNPTQVLGQLSLSQSTFPGATSELGLAMNLTKIASLPVGSANPYLPNGQPIPVTGVDPARLLTFDIGPSAKMYLDLNTMAGSAIVGVALPIQQFDSIGSRLPGINVFPNFQLPNGIKGVAGVFTGGVGQNGLAVFLDASAMLPKSTPSISAYSFLTMPTHKFFSVSNATSRQEQQIMMKLYELSSRGTKLQLAH